MVRVGNQFEPGHLRHDIHPGAGGRDEFPAGDGDPVGIEFRDDLLLPGGCFQLDGTGEGVDRELHHRVALSFGVVSTTPANNATDVPLGDPITVTFNQDVEPATLVGAIAVSSVTGNLPGVISYNSTTKTAIFTPGTPFAPLTDYTVTVDAKVKSVTTVRLPAPYVFVFRSGTGISPVSPPITTSVEATFIDGTCATLNGTVNPNGLPTQAWFEYGTDPGLQAYASSPHQDVGNGLIAQPVSTNLSVLAPGTTYYFRVCAENSAGHSAGQIMNFTTASPGSPPAVTTIAATSVGVTGATLNGSVIPNGLATDAWFEWGTDSTLASFSTTGTQAVGSGTTSQAINQALTGLTTGTTYYYRVAASNGAGTSKGTVLSFLPGAAPTVTTLTTTGVGTTGATLNGSVNPNGLATDAWFEWGTSSSLATFDTTSIQALGAGTSSQPVMATLSGLSSATTYYYRVAASNSTGTVKGTIAELHHCVAHDLRSRFHDSGEQCDGCPAGRSHHGHLQPGC